MCGAGLKGCMTSAAVDIEVREMDEHLKELSKRKDGAFNSVVAKTECDCLAPCLTTTYEADTSVVERNTSEILKILHAHENDHVLDKISYTLIRIGYKHKHFIASRRGELYGKVDFIANCGGLLCLFCGFSLISLIEFVYFLTIRLWSNFIRRWTTSRKIHQNPSAA